MIFRANICHKKRKRPYNMEEKIPEGWKKVRLGEVLKYEQPTKYIVKRETYDESFGIPVLTAGKSFILDYTDEEEGIYKQVPVIIFDDFTTESKYITFPFKVKSSAIKLLSLVDNKNNLFFLYSLMQIIKLKPGSEHKRFWISEYSKLSILLPPLPEQQKIAEILESLDKAIEKTDKIIEKYKRIKQGLMQDLLTKGITVFQFEKNKLIKAVKRAFNNKDHQFGREENLVNHLSTYLRELFSDWEVDSEVEKNEERQRPDIIIHKRNTNQNLFAIEVKKNGNLNEIKKDVEKLEKLMIDNYRYEDAVFIGFNIENFEEIFKLSDKTNFILVSKDGEIKVKERVRKFKDSPLGRIPEEWGVVRLGEVTYIKSGLYFKFSEFEEDGIRCFKIDNVGFGDVIWEVVTYLPSCYIDRYKQLVLKEKDIVIALNRPIINGKLKVAMVKKEDIPSILYQRVGKIEIKSKKLLKNYLLFTFNSKNLIKQLLQLQVGSDQPYITNSLLFELQIPLPPLPEQRRIAEILSQIDEVIEKEQRYKEKLERIKQGLMEDLLTGKVRVNHLIEEGVENV